MIGSKNWRPTSLISLEENMKVNMDFLVETDWLEKQLSNDSLRIIDCHYHLEIRDVGDVKLTSGKAAWEQAHIPGSVYIDLLTELSDSSTPLPFMMPPARQFAQVMSRNGIDDRSQVVLYDRAESTWAARLWWMLRAHGFDRVSILNGGWLKWKADGRPAGCTPAPPRTAGAHFSSRPRPYLFVNRDDVLQSLDDPRVARVCALGGDTYRKGHIPDSVNIPSISLIDPGKNTFLPPGQLARVFGEAGVTKQQRIIVYCGGAISACCDAFILTSLGYPEVAVYDGSMEEWRLDSGLPLETDCGD